MAYVCFRCKKQVSGGVRSLFQHLRAVHSINSSSNFYQCCEVGCGKTFSYIQSFRRHLFTHTNTEEVVAHLSQLSDDRLAEASGNALTPLHDTDSIDEDWDDLDNEVITERVALFLANMKSAPSSTLTSVNRHVMLTSDLIRDLVTGLQTKTMSLFNKFGYAEHADVAHLKEQFQDTAQPFRGLESEYQQMKYFVKSGHFIAPAEVRLPGASYVQQVDSESGSVRQVSVEDTYQRIPLRPLLEKLLCTPGVLQSIIAWQQRKSDVLQDLYDGELCKTHPLLSKELSIPLMLYGDDCETVNPLGAKTGIHKLGLLYFALKSLPSDVMSNLRSLFLLAVYKSDDAKTYGIDAILQPIVQELKSLEEEGIAFNNVVFKGVVRFTVVQVLGDNLGLNALLGYTKSFSGNYVCRWCKIYKEDLRCQTEEQPTLLRTISTHQADLAVANPSMTGLKRDSVLNSLIFYHITDNTAPDVMHDILEGVGPYEVKLVLNALIEDKHLTLDKLNYRLTSFDYGFSDKRNKPSPISRNDLKNVDGAMRESAAQTWCLMRLLPLMIGDLVPEGNQVWELFLLLLLCMEFIFSPSLTIAGAMFLGKIIEEHHSLFLELFPHLHLRPKHHFMLHYPRAITKLGPLRQFWAMRFEAKHGFFKRVSHTTCNFKNICKTMAFRHQMMQCHDLMSNRVLTHVEEVGPGNSTFLAEIDFIQDIQDALDMPFYSEVYVPSWITFKGTVYRAGMTVLLSYDSEGDPQFGAIKTVLLLNQNADNPIIKVVTQQWKTLGFERHLFSYAVIPTSSLKVVNIQDLLDHHPLHAARSYRENDHKRYISLRYRVF